MNATFHALLPKKLLSATMYRIARIKQPIIKNAIIRIFMKITGATLHDAHRKTIDAYDSLLDFFTRELSPNARPIAETDNDSTIVSPVDGTVAHVGSIVNGQIFQIKGYTYSLEQLVGAEYAKDYANGQATTIYLAPYNYHRIHQPMTGTLCRARYIPGELNSVSITLLDKIAGLFAKNERVVMEFESPTQEKFLMVLVGAVNVGSIETVTHGEICPNNYRAPIELNGNSETFRKGDELGRFNLGSTIIFITKNNHHEWQLHNGQTVHMGEAIATKK